jgi:hypothetical protein
VDLLAAWFLHHPLSLDSYWMWLLLPLVAAIAIVYKTLKVEDLRELPRQAAYLFVQILTFLVLAGVAIYVILAVV